MTTFTDNSSSVLSSTDHSGPDLSIVVASFNVADLLRECLASLRGAFGALKVEVYVVDNDSIDGSPELVEREFPEVSLLRNAENVGFARANNRAIREATGRYLLLLNPDTRIPPRTLEPMIAFLDEHPDVAVAGPRVERPDGRLDEACRRGFPTPATAIGRVLGLDKVFPRNRFFGRYRQTYRDPAERYEVDSVVGAFMLLRRAALDEVGVLDEKFFMFGEDLDWCYRFKMNDWKVMYLGDQRIVHHKGASANTAPHRMNWHFHKSMVLFHRKHLVQRYPFFVNWLVYCGVGLRFAAKSVVMFARRTRARNAAPVPASTPGPESDEAVAEV
ncbi:MAG: glycosyl transferase family 2 [Phycisphaeraceae bacterium]|nr:glycosyl transferase family 2 [Phycisphaeraceae bacterium]